MNSSDPIRLTADYVIDDAEVIPAGTVGIPVRFGSPEGRVEGEPLVPNNYHFPTLAGTPPWDHIVPIYSIDGVHAFGKYETLNGFETPAVPAPTPTESAE